MKKITVILIMLIWLSTSSVIAESPKVRYEVDQKYPPYTFTYQDYIYGFDFELTNMIFNTGEYNVVYSADEWQKVYERLVEGEIDLGGIIAITEKRKDEVLYTKTLYTSHASIYTSIDAEKTTLEELKNLRVGVGKGYYTEDLLRKELEINTYITYTNLENAVNDLIAGEIDVIFENQQLIDYILIKNNLKGHVVPQIINLFPVEHAYGISRGRPELVQYMNERIDELKRSGVFEELYLKHFYIHSGSYLEGRRKRILAFILGGFSIIMIGIILMKLHINRLKKKIEKDYRQALVVNKELTTTQDQLEKQYEEVKNKQNALEISEERYRLVVEGANDGLWDWNALLDIGYLSEEWRRILGFQNEEIENHYALWRESIHPEDRERVLEALKEAWKSKTSHFECEYRIRCKDSKYIWVLVKGKILRDEEGKVTRMAGSYTDISDKKEYASSMYKLAYYDTLTGLPNRTYLCEKLTEVIAELGKSNKKAALFLIGLDNFKNINDTLGHAFGDKVLKLLGGSLESFFTQVSIVARGGNDEFLILVYDFLTQKEIRKLADKITEHLNKSWEMGENEIFISASIGITVLPDDGVEAEKILINADTAMHNAKASGKGGYSFFHQAMLEEVYKKVDMEKSIRKAIEKNEFILYYQPYFCASNGEIVGVEALIRWFHPEKGFIPPFKFIPIAEETGLINTIGRWVLQEACQQNKQWQSMGLKKMKMSVNISEIQLQDKEFKKEIINVLGKTHLEAKYLVLEITESSIMRSIEANILLLNELRKLGIEIALDDFGTGYSSLSYIQKLPLDIVKIDKSFTDEIKQGREGKCIIEDIISISHKLGMKVTAEGVEIQEQLVYLRSQGCDKIQGYLLAKPMPHGEVEKLLRKQ